MWDFLNTIYVYSLFFKTLFFVLTQETSEFKCLISMYLYKIKQF